AVAGVMGLAMQRLAIRAPWKNADELAYADLIEVEAPVISRAKARADDEELVDYPGATKRPADRPDKPRVPSAARPDKPGAIGTAATAKPGKSATTTDDDGLQMATVDQDAINSVVRSKQRSLFPCLKAEADKAPGLVAKIPIEFGIGNDGRVTKLWVDHPQFKNGPLYECLLRELGKWQFKANESGGATVQLAFKLGKHS
ncbi:MAG: AgmX/PglI C-terminal domain-containing protein, partial [Myxococcaceae bacterium]